MRFKLRVKHCYRHVIDRCAGVSVPCLILIGSLIWNHLGDLGHIHRDVSKEIPTEEGELFWMSVAPSCALGLGLNTGGKRGKPVGCWCPLFSASLSQWWAQTASCHRWQHSTVPHAIMSAWKPNSEPRWTPSSLKLILRSILSQQREK